VSLIYKILDAEAWARAKVAGVYEGSAVDHTDGFIHFSTAAQAQETARRHFAGQTGLVLLTVETDAIGEPVRWEPSRGGDLFPHLYGALPASAVIEVRPIAIGDDGAPDVAALVG
jgi:uncharacterized protein (DUF952 family)